jgi:hypothetical protein
MRRDESTGQPMTLFNMREQGVRRLSVSCWICHHAAVIDVGDYPDPVPVPAFGPRMVCTRCGIVGADARPNWVDRPARESLTGVDLRRL